MLKAFWPLIPLGMIFAGTVYYPVGVLGLAWWCGYCLFCLVRSLRRQQG